MDIWVASNFLLFLIMLWKWICKYLSWPLLFASFGHRYVMTTSSKSNWKVVGPITFFLHHFSCTCIKLICLISKTYSEVSLLLLIRSYYTVLAGHHYVDQAHIDQSGFELMGNPHASAFRNLRLQVYTTHTPKFQRLEALVSFWSHCVCSASSAWVLSIKAKCWVRTTANTVVIAL